LQQRVEVRRSLPERQQRGVEGELEHRGLAIFSFYDLRRDSPSNNATVFPHRTVKIILTRGAASKRRTAHRREGNKKGNLYG